MINANEARPHLWTDIIIWKDRKRQYLFAGRTLSHPQGESVLHILLQVGVIVALFPGPKRMRRRKGLVSAVRACA